MAKNFTETKNLSSEEALWVTSNKINDLIRSPEARNKISEQTGTQIRDQVLIQIWENIKVELINAKIRF